MFTLKYVDNDLKLWWSFDMDRSNMFPYFLRITWVYLPNNSFLESLNRMIVGKFGLTDRLDMLFFGVCQLNKALESCQTGMLVDSVFPWEEKAMCHRFC